MKKMLLALLTTGFLITGCDEFNESESESPVETEQVEQVEESEDMIEVSFVILEDGEEVSEQELQLDEDTTLMQAMEENFEMGMTDEGFIESIDGLSQNPEENKWWVYEVNNEMVSESAEDFVLSDGDLVDWELTTFE